MQGVWDANRDRDFIAISHADVRYEHVFSGGFARPKRRAARNSCGRFVNYRPIRVAVDLSAGLCSSPQSLALDPGCLGLCTAPAPGRLLAARATRLSGADFGIA